MLQLVPGFIDRHNVNEVLWIKNRFTSVFRLMSILSTPMGGRRQQVSRALFWLFYSLQNVDLSFEISVLPFSGASIKLGKSVTLAFVDIYSVLTSLNFTK